MSGMFCGFIPPISGPIPRRWTDVGRPDLREASPGILPAIRLRNKSPACLSPANMAANPPESRIPPRTAGWSWRCGPALNPPAVVFSVMIRPFGPRGPYATSKGPEKRRRRLVRRRRRKKITIFGDGRLDRGDGDVFRPLSVASGPGRHLGAF